MLSTISEYVICRLAKQIYNKSYKKQLNFLKKLNYIMSLPSISKDRTRGAISLRIIREMNYQKFTRPFANNFFSYLNKKQQLF